MTRKKEEQLAFDNALKPYYYINGKEYLCKKCNKNIGSRREEHYKSCIGIGTRRLVREQQAQPLYQRELDITPRECDLGCGKQASYFYKNGKVYCSKFGNSCPIKIKEDSELKQGKNPWEGKEHPRGFLGKNPWNKGLNKSNNPIIAQSSQTLSNTFKIKGHPRINSKHTPATKAKLSAAAFRRGIGGYKIGAGKGKRGWYKGFFCDSSWELAYVIYCLEHNINIKRNEGKRQYLWKGKIKNYIPDFIVEGKYVELKGYASKEWFAKLKYSPDVKVYYQADLAEVFKYVRSKYGKDYIKLYEKPRLGEKF